MELAPALRGVGTVFHLAAQPGVGPSFGAGFGRYTRDNLLGTQRVLEAAAQAGCERVVWASSSSVYGDAEAYPCIEDRTPTRPRSPYGVTKHAAEQLCRVYHANHGVDCVALRFFTVYGPRQRPDMAMRKLCEALLDGSAFPLYGDGGQSRDCTHVADAVDATFRAARADEPAATYNVGGGHEATLHEIVVLLEELSGRTAVLDRRPAQPGDVRRTAADTSRALADLGWRPAVELREGLRDQLEWVEARRDALASTVRFPRRRSTAGAVPAPARGGRIH